jgi:hypothetical protein
MKKFTLRFIAIASFIVFGSVVFSQTQFSATFNVDMTDADPFNPATDDVYMSGSFAGWAQPGTDDSFKMSPVEAGSMIYTLTILIDSGEVQYKYFRVILSTPSWDNGEWNGDPNRKVYLASDFTYDNIWADVPFDVTFNVDMTDADPFDPETDDVYIAGSLANNWAQPGTISVYMMTPNILNSNLYSVTLFLNKGDYQYKYFRVINDVPSWDYGEWAGDPNREVTLDSTTTISNVWADVFTGLFNISPPFSYNLYPNPSENVLKISDAANINRVFIYNVSGKLLKSVEPISNEQINIDVSELDTGIYIIHLRDDKGMHTSKFVKK